jgi:Polyketide cyclase / dehydrase and lipid transport
MRILKRILIFIVLMVAIGFFMPGTTHVERSIDINAPAVKVFDNVNDLKKWNTWSPWSQLDPNAKWTYSEPNTSGQGAWYTWVSDNKNVGKGKMTIIESKQNEGVKYNLEFEGMGSSIAGFKLTPKDSLNTQVTWTMDSDNGLNPISRWFGVFMDKMLGSDFEKGLASLKKISEQ